jgi:hypothetical protein
MALLLYSSSAPYRSVNARGQAAIADMDYANTRLFYNGLYYPDETAANTAIGATKSGITRVMGTTTPFTGFNQSELSGYITATTAASGSGTETVLQLDDGSEANRIRLEYDWSNSTLYSYITISSSSTKTSLGTVAANTQFTVSFSASSGKLGFCATKSGGYTKYSAIASLPAFSKLRIGRSFTGNTWTGTIQRWVIYADRDAWGNALMSEGDSYMGGSTGVGNPLKTLGRTLSTHGGGLGGSTPENNTSNNASDIGEVGRLIAYDDFFDNTAVFWDGNAPGQSFTSTSSSTSEADRYLDVVWTGLKSYKNFVIVAPMVIRITGVSENFNIVVRERMLLRWPTQTVDWMTVLPNDGTYVDETEKLGYDGVTDVSTEGHLNATALAAMATAINSNLTGRGL